MDIDKLKDLMGRVTRGPWLREAQNVYSDDGRWMVGKAWGNDWPTTEANADLFAMAPDLAAEVIRLTAEVAALQDDRRKMHRRAQKAEGLLERMARFLNSFELWAQRRKDHWLRIYVRAAARHVRGKTGEARSLAWRIGEYERDDLIAQIIRLTAEHAQLVAANQALATENARLVKRDTEARRIIEDADLCGGDIDRPAARSFLAGEGK